MERAKEETESRETPSLLSSPSNTQESVYAGISRFIRIARNLGKQHFMTLLFYSLSRDMGAWREVFWKRPFRLTHRKGGAAQQQANQDVVEATHAGTCL